MKVVQINATCGVGSTGKICIGISQILAERDIENYILYSSKSNGYELGIKCSNDRDIKVQALRSRILGNYGFNSKKATQKIIAELDRIQPGIVHLHNIHGHDCHLEILFQYFKLHKTKIIWTFHDCWAFTGYCTHFTMAKCDKWQMHCSNCIQTHNYSWFFDRSGSLYKNKTKLFQNLDLTIVTPSHWLAGLVKESFLKDYPITVLNNGINLDIFKLRDSKFRENYNLKNKKIVLGVSFDWGESKGLDVFMELADKLPDGYQLILVGADNKIKRLLPPNILGIERTQNQDELAEIYAAADVFVNPTREDNYPTVNMEAIACGTPVITFNTGGSPEMLDETCGSVIECNDIDALEKEILRICEKKPFSREQCEYKAKTFDQNERFKEYVDLYERVITGRD